MPLTGKSAAEIDQFEKELLTGIPEDGVAIGNKRLRVEVLGWDNDLYLAVRKRLLDTGTIDTGKGKGGSVRRIVDEIQAPVETTGEQGDSDVVISQPSTPYPDEESLYPPMFEVIKERWVQDQPFDQHLVENTDRGGRRRDGIWSRPDVTVAAMTSYTYVPGRHFDVITFEIKHHSGFNMTAVYEALSHRRAASRSYVLVFIPDDQLEAYENPVLSDVAEEANRHGIGLIVASDPSDFDTWDIREEATRVSPDPARMNTFIRNQLSEGTRDQIVRWFRV